MDRWFEEKAGRSGKEGWLKSNGNDGSEGSGLLRLKKLSVKRCKSR